MNTDVSVPQVSNRHADVPAVQQGLDQGEDLRAAPPSGPAGDQVKERLESPGEGGGGV